VFGPGTDAAIERLCARLDGLPLAIELAAARVAVMSPAEILASLDTQIGGLGGGARRAPAHHRTVREAVAWSHRLLDGSEQEAFRSLAVFAGGFDACAGAAVAGVSLDLLMRLVDKSLIAARETVRGSTRYALLETVREYAFERLAEAGEVDAARQRHLRHFAALADRCLQEWLQTGRQRFVNQLDDDYENVRAALEWAVVSDPCAGLPMLAGTRDLFYKFGQADGLRLAERLLERCRPRDRNRVAAQIAAGQLAISTGDLATAIEVLTEACESSRQLAEPRLEAWACWFRGLAETVSDHPERGRVHLEASLALHRELGIRIGEARALAGLAGGYLWAGEPARSKELHEAALAIYRAEDDRWGQGQCHTFLGMVAEDLGTGSATATSHYRQAVELLRPFRDASLLPVALLGQAGIIARRDPDRALRVLAAASAIRAGVGGQFQPVFRARADKIHAAAAAALGTRCDEVWAAGARLGLDDAVAVAFGTSKPRDAAPAGLSERELEVVGMVADGLPNKAIAARLQLSVRTVESHVRHALAKLGLENRTQLATWARQRTQ
jgi:non-specific serine/threonine protein kinase